MNENYSNLTNLKHQASKQQSINSKQSTCIVVDKSPSTVPALTNVDEIFYVLSQKIAKYCQILSDLTNCEVFYKAHLPITSNSVHSSSSPASDNSTNNKSKKSKQTPSNKNRSQQRSLYWGTHQMLFHFSHEKGIRFDKSAGDSLIKLNHRSISMDVNKLIDEILHAPLATTTNSSTDVASTSNAVTKRIDNILNQENKDANNKTVDSTTVNTVDEFNLIKEISHVQQEGIFAN